MKKLNKQIRLTLDFVWEQRLKLYADGDKLYAEGHKLWAEGDKLRAEGHKLWAEGDKLYAEGNKLCAEGNKLRAEGHKLYAEGHKLWSEGILRFVGNIKLEWTAVGCKLETGDVFLNAPADGGRRNDL